MNYSTEKHFEFDDFKDGEHIEKLTGHNFDTEPEIECEVSCTVYKYRAATYTDPAEGGTEDFQVLYIKGKTWIDLTEFLTNSNIEEEITEEAYEHENGAADIAAEARADAIRDEGL